MMTLEPSAADATPRPGEWPVDPQEDVPIEKDRIWIDGCFDFSHHGQWSTPECYTPYDH